MDDKVDEMIRGVYRSQFRRQSPHAPQTTSAPTSPEVHRLDAFDPLRALTHPFPPRDDARKGSDKKLSDEAEKALAALQIKAMSTFELQSRLPTPIAAKPVQLPNEADAPTTSFDAPHNVNK
jgi:hypothetical protein